MSATTTTTVLPGQHVPAQHVNLKLGPGLLQHSDASTSASPSIIATRAGTLHHSANRAKWWVESNSRRVRSRRSRLYFFIFTIGRQYIPAPQESVIGIIVQKAGEGFRVDIGSAHPASLDGLAFEGATKRNRPNLKVRRAQFSQKILGANFLCSDWQSNICARLARAQRHGAGAGMFRRADAQSRGLRRAQGRVHGAL